MLVGNVGRKRNHFIGGAELALTLLVQLSGRDGYHGAKLLVEEAVKEKEDGDYQEPVCTRTRAYTRS